MQPISSLLPRERRKRSISERPEGLSPKIPDTRVFIVPTQFSQEATAFIATERQKGHTALACGVAEGPVRCTNCQGHQTIFVRTMTHGPYAAPWEGTKFTYFEGDRALKPGWYIGELKSFPCPDCAPKLPKQSSGW